MIVERQKYACMRTQRKCENCGKVFAVRSGNQRYCCEACAEQAKQNRKKRRNDFINAVEPLIDLQNQEYLSFSKAAMLMGCTRQYIYKLVGQGRLKASRLSSRMSLIRRADIESMLAASPYERVLPVVRTTKVNPNPTKRKTQEAGNGPMEYYTGEEVMATFKIGQGWLYTCAKRYHIRTCRIAGHIYYSKPDIDTHFGIMVDVSDITEWLTTSDVEEQFGMKASAIRAYAYRHHIPTKKEHGTACYSKTHIEELRRPDLISDNRYVTVEEAAGKYGLSKANLHHIVKVKGIGKVKVGVRNLLVREDVERVMAEREADGL